VLDDDKKNVPSQGQQFYRRHCDGVFTFAHTRRGRFVSVPLICCGEIAANF
jgi:hypothetical protein